jgi:catechol 2,3-dioxygenase-like lactoylglutathione lyase family enzyme
MATRKARRAKKPARPVRARAKKKVANKKTASARSAAGGTPDRRKAGRETLRLRTLEPSFTVNDLDKSLRFYTDALGFIVGQRWTNDSGKLIGVMLKAGVCQLGLSQDDWAKGRDRKKGEAMRVWCTTAQDIDALAAKVKAGGFALVEEPKDQAWGGRAFSVDDPDGFHLTIYRPA